MADDPYLASGRKVLSGDDDTSSTSSATDDPYLASGRKALAAAPATSGADTKSDTISDPYGIEHAWIQIPALHNFAAGVTQGARDVVKSGLDLGAWVDKRVPVLSWLDRANPLIGDPEARQAEFERQRQQYEASPEGQSYTGGAGRLYGQIGTTAPLVGPVAEGVGAGVNALAALAPKVPAIIPWAVRMATEGGVAGGLFGGLTEGGSDQPVGQSVIQNAELGAALGPPASVAAKVAGLGARVAGAGYNYVTGRSAGLEVEQAMAEARARAGGGGEPHPAPGAPAAAPTPPAPPGTPTAAGAAPTSESELIANAPGRSREIAGKVDALDKIISDRPNIGRSDFTEYVKGNLPTQAEGLGDARLASIQRQVEPGDQRYTNFRSAAIDNRLDHFERRAGTAEQLDTKEADLRDWDAKTLGPVWAKKQPVDASGVLGDVDARLASPTAQIGPVEDALNEVRSRLFKRGTDELHTDPEMLYGARRQISYMLSRAGRQANPAYGSDDVMRELIGVRDQLDKAIEPGAPGFKNWLTGHADAMREIDRMDVLQSMRQKLIGANGDIQLSRLNGALKGLRTKMAQSGANQVHSLDLEDIEMLRDLNKDLLRENNKTLSMPAGSPTSHNREVLAEHGLAAVNALAQAGAERIPGGRFLLEQTMGRTAARNAARQKELWIRNLLQPGAEP
jgi:hypothetical protein